MGDQRASYNQELKFRLRINDPAPRPSVEDIIIEGGGAKTTRISLSITDQNNPVPAYEVRIKFLSYLQTFSVEFLKEERKIY